MAVPVHPCTPRHSDILSIARICTGVNSFADAVRSCQASLGQERGNARMCTAVNTSADNVRSYRALVTTGANRACKASTAAYFQ